MSIQPAKISLEVISGPHAGQRWAFDRVVKVIIGRQAPAQLRFPLELAMSAQHCELMIEPPRVALRDLSSTNGTLVNEVQIAEAALMDGDEFGIGDTRIRVNVVASFADALPKKSLAMDDNQTIVHSNIKTPRPTKVFPEAIQPIGKGFDVDQAPLSKLQEAGETIELTPVEPHNGDPTIGIVQGSDPNPSVSRANFSADPSVLGGAVSENSKLEFCGPYKLLDLIGEGGMAVVYRAEHRKSGQMVAIKLIKAPSGSSQKLLQLFVREASVLLRLNHPRIVRSIEFGFQDQQPFLVLEWLPVIDLLELIDPLPQPKKIRMACWSVSRILQALHFAHQEGFVHRDVKPSNILAYREAKKLQVKLGDFGLAKCFDDAGLTAMTDDYSLRGTLSYMSPEQMHDSRSVGPKSDIFSSGACLYRLLTGKHPKLTGHGVEPEPDVLLAADLPKPLTEFILRAMHAEPKMRFNTAADFEAKLQVFHGKP